MSKREKVELLVDNFLQRLNDAHTANQLSTSIFSMCAAMGLTIDRERRKYIEENFMHKSPLNQTFKDFKQDLIISLRGYLLSQVK